MAGLEFLIPQKAIAMDEALETIQRLLGEGSPSDRLVSARDDVTASTMDDFVFSMLIAELTRVVAAQQERIDALEKTKPAGATKK